MHTVRRVPERTGLETGFCKAEDQIIGETDLPTKGVLSGIKIHGQTPGMNRIVIAAAHFADTETAVKGFQFPGYPPVTQEAESLA
jgi:hypothetical protein